MKSFKFLTIVAAAAMIAISGCKKDDENDVEDLLGKWFLKKEVTKTYMNGSSPVTQTDENFTSSDYVEFKSDGKGTFYEEGDTDNFTYTLTNDGTKLNIKFDGENEPDVLDVKTLNSSELVLYKEESYTEQTMTIKETTESTFKR